MFLWILQKYNVIYVTNRKLRYLPFYKYNKFNTFRNIYTINKFTSYIPSISVKYDEIQLYDFDELVNYLNSMKDRSQADFAS